MRFFRGHLEECVRHLGDQLSAKAPKGTRGCLQAKKPIADFCGVSLDSAALWLQGGNLPIGDRLIKLTCYLDMIGYRVIELERMPKGRRNLVELIGFGILTTEKAVDLLGYSSASSLYQVLQGNQGISESKEEKAWDIWRGRKEDLQQKKEKAFELYSLDSKPTASKTPEERQVLSSGSATIKIMEGLLIMLEQSSLEDLSDKDFAEFQKSADVVLRLSAKLSTLSSRLLIRKGAEDDK